MAQAFFGIPSTQLSWPSGSDAAWTDLDLSAYIPAGATGAVIHVGISSGSAYYCGFRKKGSIDDFYGRLNSFEHCWFLVAVDSNRIMQVRGSNDIRMFLVGYTAGDGVTLFTDAVDITPATKDAFVEIDLSSVAPGALAVILTTPTDNVGYMKARAHGSTDDFPDWYAIRAHSDGTIVVPCDENQHIDISCASARTFMLQGYITKGFVPHINAVNKTITTYGSYEEIQIDTAAVFAFFTVNLDGYQPHFDISLNGDSTDIFHTITGNNGYSTNPIVPCDAQGKVQAYLQMAGGSFYLRGYATEYSEGIPAAPFKPRIVIL